MNIYTEDRSLYGCRNVSEMYFYIERSLAGRRYEFFHPKTCGVEHFVYAFCFFVLIYIVFVFSSSFSEVSKKSFSLRKTRRDAVVG